MSQRRDRYQLEVPTTVTVGRAQNVADLQDKWVQVRSITGTASLEGRIGDTFDPLFLTPVGGAGSTTLANGFAPVPQGVLEVRINRSVNGAGEVWLSGLARSAS